MKQLPSLLLATACAVSAAAELPSTSVAVEPPSSDMPRSVERVTEAAATPLSDLNLIRTHIPPALKAAQQNPYGAPIAARCDALVPEVETLNALLGPDLDMASSPSDPSLLERGGNAAGNAALGAIKGAAEGIVPFRAWVRKLTGAERGAREAEAAIAAGAVRRAYLKGMGQAMGCEPPAAPRPPHPPS